MDVKNVSPLWAPEDHVWLLCPLSLRTTIQDIFLPKSYFLHSGSQWGKHCLLREPGGPTQGDACRYLPPVVSGSPLPLPSADSLCGLQAACDHLPVGTASPVPGLVS